MFKYLREVDNDAAGDSASIVFGTSGGFDTIINKQTRFLTEAIKKLTAEGGIGGINA